VTVCLKKKWCGGLRRGGLTKDRRSVEKVAGRTGSIMAGKQLWNSLGGKQVKRVGGEGTMPSFMNKKEREPVFFMQAIWRIGKKLSP